MSNRFVAFLLCCVAAFTGCGDATPNLADVDLAKTVAELAGHHNTIKAAFEAETPDDAHGALHQVGHALEKLPALAAKSSLSAEQQDSVKKATETLFDGYGALDEVMHGEGDTKYADVAQKLNDAFESLTDIIPLPTKGQ